MWEIACATRARLRDVSCQLPEKGPTGGWKWDDVCGTCFRVSIQPCVAGHLADDTSTQLENETNSCMSDQRVICLI
jgi:hypothetical protein